MREHIECDLTLVAVTQDWTHPCTALIALPCCTSGTAMLHYCTVMVQANIDCIGAVMGRPRGVSGPSQRSPETCVCGHFCLDMQYEEVSCLVVASC